MNTDELIRVMAADTARPAPIRRVLPAVVAAAAAVSGVAFLETFGVRADLAAALRLPAVWLKHLFPVALAVAAFGAAVRVTYPDETLGAWRLAVGAPLAVVLLAFLGAALATAPAAWGALLMTPNTLPCLLSVLLMGVPVLAGSLWAMRRGACTRPRLGGALAGLASGSVAAVIYAFHCVEDSPVFYGIWYCAGIALVVALGAALGPRLLRW